jgi:hypothetical protein
VFTVDTEPVSRYDDFSGTDALISAGRANANIVLDFWENGGIGDSFGPVTTAADPVPDDVVDLASTQDEAV